MKVGDLVKRTGPMAAESSQNIGIVVMTDDESYDGDCSANESKHHLIKWGGDHGTFWTPHWALEVVNESR